MGLPAYPLSDVENRRIEQEAQNRVAGKLGPDGWWIFMSLSQETQDALVQKELAGAQTQKHLVAALAESAKSLARNGVAA